MEAETEACQVCVSQQGSTEDGALFFHEVMDVPNPLAENIVRVMDHPQAQAPSSFSEVCEPAEAETWRSIPHPRRDVGRLWQR
jgi:hypothetical protein